jgi:hypothetical protein
MSTIQLFCLSFFTPPCGLDSPYLSHFNFWLLRVNCNCQLLTINSLRCQLAVNIVFLVSIFLMHSNQKQFNYHLCKASHGEQLKGSRDIPGHRRKLSQWTTPSHVLHTMKVVGPCKLAAKSRAVVAWAAFHKHVVLHKQHMCLLVPAPLWPTEVGPQSSICRPPDIALNCILEQIDYFFTMNVYSSSWSEIISSFSVLSHESALLSDSSCNMTFDKRIPVFFMFSNYQHINLLYPLFIMHFSDSSCL